MLLLDANVLLNANKLYYPLKVVPEFWEWLRHQAESGEVKMPLEIIEEITDGGDDLAAWLGDDDCHAAMCLDEVSDADRVRAVLLNGYGRDLTDEEVAKIGRDPFLIAAALGDTANRRVITAEVSASSKQRANRKVPDVCVSLGVRWSDPFALIRDLNFSTGWRGRS